MRNTFFYYDFSQLSEEEKKEQEERRAGGSIIVEFSSPPEYSGAVPPDLTGPGTRPPAPTPPNGGVPPSYVGYEDFAYIAGLVNENGDYVDYDQFVLRVEQHPSVIGIPINITFVHTLSNGITVEPGNILHSQPVLQNGEIGLEVAIQFPIEQSTFISYLNNIKYNNDYLIMASTDSTNLSLSILALKTLLEFEADQEQDLDQNPKRIEVPGGDASYAPSSGDPYIIGTAEQRRILSIGMEKVTDIDITFPVSYQWFRTTTINSSLVTNPIENQKSSYYIVKREDVENYITVGVLYINTAGEITEKYSKPVEIKNSLPTGEITITTVTAEVGSIIFSDTRNIQDLNQISGSTYQWQRSQTKPLRMNSPWIQSWSNIDGANSTMYQITTSDTGKELRLTLNITDSLGGTGSLSSNVLGPVNTDPIGNVYISGVPKVGATLYPIKNFSDPDVYQFDRGRVVFQWLRDGYPINGATGIFGYDPKYVVSADDFSKNLSVKATYTDDRGKTHRLLSNPVQVVSNTPSGFFISGISEVKHTLKGEIKDLVDFDLVGQRQYINSSGETIVVQNGKVFEENVTYQWSIIHDLLGQVYDAVRYDSDLLISNSNKINILNKFNNLNQNPLASGPFRKLLLKDNLLYACKGSRVVYYDLSQLEPEEVIVAGDGEYVKYFESSYDDQEGNTYNIANIIEENGLDPLSISLNSPKDIFFDSLERLYIVEGESNKIRRINLDGTVSTYAGVHNTEFLTSSVSEKEKLLEEDPSLYTYTVEESYKGDYSGNSVNASQAKFNGIQSTTMDNSGNIYIADSNNHLIRKIDQEGIISDFAGIQGQDPILDIEQQDKDALQFSLNYPKGILFINNNLYISDEFERIIKIDLQTNIASTVRTGVPASYLSKRDEYNFYVLHFNSVKIFNVLDNTIDNVYVENNQIENITNFTTSSTFFVEDQYYNKNLKCTAKYVDSFNIEKQTSASKRITNSAPIGQPEISGVVGITLPVTLSVSNIRDNNSPSSSQENETWDFFYKFKIREKSEFSGYKDVVYIDGASGSIKGNQTASYTISKDYYYGGVLTAEVKYEDGQGYLHKLENSVTIPAVQLPYIVGTLEQTDILQSNLSLIENMKPEYSGQQNPPSSSVKWFRADTTSSVKQEISQGETYEITSDDVEKYLFIEATYMTNVDDVESRFSMASFVKNSIPTSPKILSNTELTASGYRVGDTLQVDFDSIIDKNGIKTIDNYQWYVQEQAHGGTIPRNLELTGTLDISGAIDSFYVIREEDQAKRLGFKARLIDGLDREHLLDSGFTRRVDYDASATISIVGEGKIGNILSTQVSIDDFDGANPKEIYTTWFSGDNIVSRRAGANSNQYLVTISDYNKNISAAIEYRDMADRDLRVFNSSNSVFVDQTSGSGFFIAGTPEVSGTLFAVVSSIQDPEGINQNSFTYKWYSDLTQSSNTSSVYVVDESEYGKEIKAEVTYLDNFNNSTTLEDSVVIRNTVATGNIIFKVVSDANRNTSSLDPVTGSYLNLQLSNLYDINTPKNEEERNNTIFNYEILMSNPYEDDLSLLSGSLSGSEFPVEYQIPFSSSYSTKLLYGKVSFTDGKGNLEQSFSNSIIVSPIIEEIEEQQEDEDSLINTTPLSSFGTGETTIKLESDSKVIYYDVDGKNPDKQSIKLTSILSGTPNDSYAFEFFIVIFVKGVPNYRYLNQEPWDQKQTRIYSIPLEKFDFITFGVRVLDEENSILAVDYINIYGV